MAKEFVLSYAKMIAKHPESLSVEVNSIDESANEITILTHADDIGKLIGKEGRMINAIKTVISGCKAKDGKSYKVNVKAIA